MLTAPLRRARARTIARYDSAPEPTKTVSTAPAAAAIMSTMSRVHMQNERGHFFSEGNYDILGPPLTDGYDMIGWIAKQPWSNGKVGMVGCSSTAEYQFGVAATEPPALAAMNPQGFGAGIGHVGPYTEQGNWYRGGLYHENMPFNTPSLYYMSWYDVSVGPNLAMFEHARKTAKGGAAEQQYAVIAPTLHCAYTRATENTVVGERSVGDARLDYDVLTYGWFDHFLKGEDSGLLDTLARVRYYTMGSNKWQTSDSWPPRGAAPVTYYFSSAGNANTLHGDGALAQSAPSSDHPDSFIYDPMNPVPSHGGNVCCTGNAVQGGAFDQRVMEARNDILVYSTEPLKEGVEVSGPVAVTLYVSSDAKDTDFTAKLIDVYPDGRAYNLDETIQRMRYREGYDKQVWMKDGQVYKVTLGPMNTSNYFAAGHRIRVEISSSNFPRFDRNLNTGGKNYDETKGVVARNSVHHSRKYPSSVAVSVVRK